MRIFRSKREEKDTEKGISSEDSLKRVIEEQQLKFNIGCIGVGKAGIHFLDALYRMDVETGVNQIYPIALPSSRFDYVTAPAISQNEEEFVFPFGAADPEVRYTGVGGNQRLGQKIAIEDSGRIVAKIDESIKEYEKKIPVKAIVLVGSLAGGTGGGSLPVLAKVLKLSFPDFLIMIIGVLPEKREGNIFFANSARSLQMILSLLGEKDYVDCFLLFENMIVRSGGMLQGYDYINNTFARTFNLIFGSTYSVDTLDPQDKMTLIKKGGREGLGLMNYYDLAFKGEHHPNPQDDREVEAAKANIIRILHENLDGYPRGTVESAGFGAYQIRCDQSLFPFDVRNILNEKFEERLKGKKATKVPYVKGGVWPQPKSQRIEIGTMILGIRDDDYEYLGQMKRKWNEGVWENWYSRKEFEEDLETVKNLRWYE
jgi:cell division GTPase FtsZ